MENLRIYVATYNVGTATPEQDLQGLLSLKNDKLPDLYVLSFQEVKAQPQNMLLDSLYDDPWTYECKSLLYTKNYIQIKSLRLQGLLIMVFSLKKHLLNIREVDTEYTRTGLAGMWGNKGAVSVRLSIYGCSICFVNAHLSAHDAQLKDRVEDYNSIVNDQNFHVDLTSKIFYHDYVFWMGDLNFRLVEEYDQTPEEIERSINKKELKKLFEFDQLRYVMKKGEAFHELTEQDPEFPPTFKFEVGTSTYDYKRRPAWCDRILYKVNRNSYENITLKIDQLSYKSHPEYTLSDHKPVSADFIIQVFSDYAEIVVKFENIASWREGEENNVAYEFTQDIPETSEDWIGLFRENFRGLDEYVNYEYVSKSCKRLPGNKKFEVTFSELPKSGKYCLIYFSQNEDKVTSVLGISNVFEMIKNLF